MIFELQACIFHLALGEDIYVIVQYLPVFHLDYTVIVSTETTQTLIKNRLVRVHSKYIKT